MMSSSLSKSIWLHWYKNLIWVSPKNKIIGTGTQSICFWCWYIAGKLPNCFWFQEEFIDIQCDTLLRNAFKKIGQFWTKIKNEKSIVGTHTVKILLPFINTSLCECGFSCLHRSKQRRGTVLSLKTTWDRLWARLFQILTKLWKRSKTSAYID